MTLKSVRPKKFLGQHFLKDQNVAKAIADPARQIQLVNDFLNISKIHAKGLRASMTSLLLDMPPKQMVTKMIAGIKRCEVATKQPTSLMDLVDDDYPFVSDPMPNLYFTRDPGACVGEGINIHRMHTPARKRESLLLKYMFLYNRDFATQDNKMWYDLSDSYSIEGGDVLVLSKDIVAVDQFGTLYKGCNSAEAHKNWLGEVTNPRQIKGGLKEALAGADVFIGVSKPGILTTELCKTMNKDAIIFACANPTPEIFPDDAKAGGAKVISTGRSDFPNQINNVLAFPGIFRGAFDVRASDINDEMKIAASKALADLITDEELSPEYIIPKAFDKRVGPAVAKAVAEAAKATGVARI